MAVKATPDRVGADMQPSNFRAAVALIRTSIQQYKNTIKGTTSKIGDVWAKIEGHKVDKAAAKDFERLDKMEPEKRVEYMRSLNGLIDAAGWEETAADLVDVAESNVVHMRMGGAQAPAEGDDGDGEGGEPEGNVESGEAEQPAPRRTRKKAGDGSDANATIAQQAEERKSVLRGMDAAKSHLSGGGEPYTGDNSDLAGE